MTRAILPTIGSAVLASIVFVPVSALLFPSQIAELSVPLGTGNRILWTCLPAVLMALAVTRGLSPQPNDASARE